jgi:ABC-type hemin transport system substrate-binding protein
MDGITDRELALVKLKTIQETYHIDSLKPMIHQIEQLMKENKAARRVLKKFEIGIWPPRITLEWEFPFKK